MLDERGFSDRGFSDGDRGGEGDESRGRSGSGRGGRDDDDRDDSPGYDISGFAARYDARDGGSIVCTYSFEDLCLPLRSELLCYVLNLTNNDEAFAEDILQDAYIKAFRAWPTWAPTHGLPEIDARGWMYRIVCHRFMSAYRALKRRNSVLRDAIRDPALSRKVDLITTPGASPLEDYSDEMHHALSNLSPERQTVVQLCDVDGKSPTEVSRLLGVPLGTVNSRLYRAHEEMRESLRVAKAAPAVMCRRRQATTGTK